jgi:hypothetical protein
MPDVRGTSCIMWVISICVYPQSLFNNNSLGSYLKKVKPTKFAKHEKKIFVGRQFLVKCS